MLDYSLFLLDLALTISHASELLTHRRLLTYKTLTHFPLELGKEAAFQFENSSSSK